LAAKEQIELALYHHLRDLFSFKPDLVLYDITSTYFEGAGPANFAKHGYSHNGKPHNVHVVVAMVAGWPIAHHVWAGNTVDHSTVQEVVRDLHQQFRFNRIVFVGDRGMVTDENLNDLAAGKHGYLVGVKRRRNQNMEQWLSAIDETKWIDRPAGITARERVNPPRTRAQEVPSGTDGVRIIVVDSDERRGYEEGMRQKSMNRTREQLQKLADHVAAGKLKQPEKIGAAAACVLQRNHGHRYYTWDHAEIVRMTGRSYRLRHQSDSEGKEVDDSKPANAPSGSEEGGSSSKPANARSGSREGGKGGGKPSKKR